MEDFKNMFRVLKKDGEARLGVLDTPSGPIETPSYVVVATDGHIRTLEPEDIPKTKTQIAIANTYHLWRSLGDKGLSDFPGLHDFMDWPGLIMTDSGGFQVFSLGAARETGVGKIQNDEFKNSQSERNLVKITDSGVYFCARQNLDVGGMEDGEEIYLDAELSIRIQDQLGSDIVLAFDEPSSPLHDYAYTQKAMERTHVWAKRSLEAKTSNQKIYGIVQGGHFEDLRRKSAKFIGSLPFDGFAIGGSFGSSFGSQKTNTFQELSWVNPFLPENKPRHLLGIGRIEDIFEAVEQGIDTMDCVIPTREARHGGIWSQDGRLDILKGRYQDDENPLVEGCECPTCGEEEITKSKLHNLFKAKNLDAARLATIHNLYFFNELMAQIREAIRESNFLSFKKNYLKL